MRLDHKWVFSSLKNVTSSVSGWWSYAGKVFQNACRPIHGSWNCWTVIRSFISATRYLKQSSSICDFTYDKFQIMKKRGAHKMRQPSRTSNEIWRPPLDKVRRQAIYH